MSGHGATWTLVTKVLCGHRETLSAILGAGVSSVGESRLGNVRAIRKLKPSAVCWYLRIPTPSRAGGVAELCDVSLDSEIGVIAALSERAFALGRTHGVVIMIELGDLREGILPGSLVSFYRKVFDLPGIEVKGIGTNLGCLSGSVPSVDQLMQLVLYRELLELKFGHTLPLISAGSTVVLPLLLEGKVPKAVNHFRIGEAVFLGTNLLDGGTLKGLRNDAFTLEAEISEIKEKGLVPLGETSQAVAPFGGPEGSAPPGRTGYRAIVNLGHLDTDVGGLVPEDPAVEVAGASSDLTVLNIGDGPGSYRVGGVVRFRLSYAALLRVMSTPYIEKVVRDAGAASSGAGGPAR